MFQRLADGGLQQVIAKDAGDSGQISLIQEHLVQEATKFRNGDFADPAAIHGDQMAGLAELRTSAGALSVAYRALPNGGEIRYITSDAALTHALHRWFDAQLSDHGSHAMEH